MTKEQVRLPSGLIVPKYVAERIPPPEPSRPLPPEYAPQGLPSSKMNRAERRRQERELRKILKKEARKNG